MNLAESFHLISTACFVFGSAVVGISLLRLASRSRELPELLLAGAILGTAVLGYGTLIASMVIRGAVGPGGGEVTALVVGLTATGKILHDLGVSCFIFFVVYVFRRRDRWAHLLAGLLLATLWSGLAWGAIIDDSFRAEAAQSPAWWCEYAVIWTYPIWLATESLRYWAILCRRRKLGLSDPMVTNRFALWGGGSIFMALSIWFASTPFFLMDRPEMMQAAAPAIHYATAVVGLISISCSYLAFLPPGWYARHVLASAAAEAT